MHSMSSFYYITIFLPILVFAKMLPNNKLLPKIRCQATGECYCPEDPLTEKYSDPEDPTCQHYYLCHLNRAYLKVCDVRTAFHPEKGDCIPRQQIPEKYCKFPVRCPLFHNLYVEDPHDCSKYYLCFYQRPSHYSCPEGNYFDPQQQKCIHDTYQAEACEEQAKLEKAEKQRLESDPKITSNALNQARKDAGILVKDKTKIVPKPKNDVIDKLSPIGHVMKGGSKNIF